MIDPCACLSSGLSNLYSLLASTQWTNSTSKLLSTSALRQDMILMSIFHYMEIKQSSCLERHNGSTTAGDKFSLYIIGCCGEQSGCSAFKLLACVIKGLWFGKGPGCHDVYFKQRAVDFHSFTSSVVFHEDGQILTLLPTQGCAPSLPSALKKCHKSSGEEGANLQFTLCPRALFAK